MTYEDGVLDIIRSVTGTPLPPLEYLSVFYASYVETALWSSSANGYISDDGTFVPDEGNDSSLQSLNFDEDDLHHTARYPMQLDCMGFVQANWDILEHFRPDATGHDFWLTRNHHGAGFWDGDYPDSLSLYSGAVNVGDELTKASQAAGEVDLYVGDDGKVYQEP